MADLPSAPDVARLLADALETASLPYAIGGALAFGYHAPPRATNDVDIDVFIALDRLDELFVALEAAGASVDRDEARASADARGDLRAHVQGMRVDVFVPSIPLYDSAAQRVRRVDLLGRPACILAAEDLTLFKLLFFRPKDLIDVDRMVAFQGSALDRRYVRRWLVDMVGEDDERVIRWDAIVVAHPVDPETPAG